MQRRSFFKAAGLGAIAASIHAPLSAQSQPVTFLVCHGAWSAGWAWKKMHPLLTKAGHRLIAPTYTGVGERSHLASPSTDLETNIQDILGVVKYEELNNFVLIGHSYGGMVATGVVDRIPERIIKLIYIDAFVPRDGQSLLDLVSPEARQRMIDGVKAGDGWRAPPNPVPKDTLAEDTKWIEPLRVPHPMKCFAQQLRLTQGDTKRPRAYIYCKRIGAEDTFRQFADRAKRERWDYREIDASHSPNVSAPALLAELLMSIATTG
jgi:pimeloyl-ACP methyl ester carboxylesterase